MRFRRYFPRSRQESPLKCVAALRGHFDVIWSIKFAPSGTNFITTSGDGTAKLWDLKRIPGGEAFLPPPTQQMAK
jgi:WD40 repeat protein